MRFSDVFSQELKTKSQKDFDFVNIRLDTDIPLYIDASRIELQTDSFFKECNEIIKSFVDKVIALYSKPNSKDEIEELLSHSSETNATHIGVSQGKSVGKGNSAEKLKEVFSQIVADRLIAEGLIEDVMDFYIFIDNFGPDMMSDLLTSLLKEKIVEYTLEQCNLYNIPLSGDEHDLKEAWSLKEQKWIPIKAKIVEYKGEPILLLPKKIMVASYLYEPYQYLSKDILPRRKEELKIFLENAPLEEQQKYYDKNKGKTRKDQPSFEKIKEIEIKNIMSVKNYLIMQTKKDINLIRSFKQRVLNIMQGTSVNSNKLSDQKIEEIVKQTYERDKLKKK